MLRISGQVPKLAKPSFTPRTNISTGPRRCESMKTPLKEGASKAAPPPPPPPPAEPSRGGGGVFGKLLGLTVLGTGGVIGYSWYDPNFRKQVEDNVPYSKEAYDYIFQYLPAQQGAQQQKLVFTPPQNKPAIESGKPKELAPTGPIVSDVDQVKEQSLIKKKKVPEPEPQKDAKTLKKEAEAKKKQEEAERKRQQDELARKIKEDKEMEEAAENAALENILENTIADAQDALSVAKEAQQKAVSATKDHSKLLKNAMEMPEDLSGIEQEWQKVTDANLHREDMVSNAQIIAGDATELVEKLKAAIKEGKDSAVTKKNKALRAAEQKLSDLSYDLKTAVAELNKAESEAKVMREYRDLVRKGKDQFKKELEAITPDVKIGGRFGGRLTEDELNSLIAHAHRRIEQLQKQLIEQQTLEQVRIESALRSQKEEDNKLSDERVKREEEKLRDQFKMEKLVWDAEAQVRYEQEMRAQLKRQAAAHSDHLQEVLTVRERELNQQFEVDLQYKLVEERAKLNEDVVGYIARVEGIEKAVDARADKDRQGRNARKLWLASQAMLNSITRGKEEAARWEEQVKPLDEDITAVKDAGNDHPFINTVISSVPEEAVKRGVWTEAALTERFNKVYTICRRVALIDETGGTLFRYFLSYAQSLLVFASRPLGENEEVDPDSLNAFKILDNARYCLERGDLEQALRFMNQLKGEPRKAANDWMKEARLMLEARQAASAILAFASAEGVGSLS